jgi:ATPase subunit of ABC transporter with duplicated ATPase domains
MLNMGHVDVSAVSLTLPDGRPLLNQVSFRVGDGVKAALIGPNGTGKTTLMKIIAGDLKPEEGSVARSGGLGVMRQFIGSIRDESTVRDLLLSVAPDTIRKAAAEHDASELAMMENDEESTQIRYAQALSDWAEVGGYEIELFWDQCVRAAMSKNFDEVRWRLVRTLSGGEQKRLVLEALLRGPDQVLLLDEPDNYLDVPGKEWLEDQILQTSKTVLFISHDRELLSRAANRVITLEQGAAGSTAWVHGGSFDTWAAARDARNERLEEILFRWEQEHQRLKDLVRTLQQQAKNSPAMAGKYHAMQTRLAKFEEVGPPQSPPLNQRIKMRLGGSRTGVRVITAEDLRLIGLTEEFNLEVFYEDRIAILGANGSGKSHFLRLLAGDNSVRHTGQWKLGARVISGFFAQTHAHPEFLGRSLEEILWTEHSLQRQQAAGALGRYGMAGAVDQRFETLSGGQQARFQVLLLELEGVTLLLLDEPTDNLDLASAEALEEALTSFTGTVVAVTHDRWFARGFDRFLIFGRDGSVRESTEPVWREW